VGSRNLPRDRLSPKERGLGGGGLTLLRQGEGCRRKRVKKFLHLIHTPSDYFPYFLFFVDLAALEAALKAHTAGDTFGAARILKDASKGVVPLDPELARAYLRDAPLGIWVGEPWPYFKVWPVQVDVFSPTWDGNEDDESGLWLSLSFGEFSQVVVYIDHRFLELARAASS
jgi:hypothetical protein